MVVAAFNQEKALVGAFSVITNLRMELFDALLLTHGTLYPPCQGKNWVARHPYYHSRRTGPLGPQEAPQEVYIPSRAEKRAVAAGCSCLPNISLFAGRIRVVQGESHSLELETKVKFFIFLPWGQCNVLIVS